MLFAHAFVGNTLHVAGCDPVTIANRIQAPSVRANPVRGPYLTIVVVGEYPEAHGYAPLRAYAQPIFSGNRFVPVETTFERDVLRAMLEARRLFDRVGIDVRIKKPVFDSLTPLGPYRADFLFEACSRLTGEIRQLVIAAVSSETADDIGSKAVSLGDLGQIAPIVRIEQSTVERGKLYQVLSEALA